MRLTRALLASCLLLSVACGGTDSSGGNGPAPTGVLKVAATGLPAGYTAPYTLLRDGVSIATDALSAGDSLLYPGLALGTYVVKWGNRITQTGGATFTWGASADTVVLAAPDILYLATGHYAAITGGLVIAPTGPAGTGIQYHLEPIAGGTATWAVAQVDLPARVWNLAPGAYRVVPTPSSNIVDGIGRTITSDTIQALVVAGPAVDTVQPDFRPLEAVVEVVVLGLPTGARGYWGITDVGGAWSVGGSAPGGKSPLPVPHAGSATAFWADVVFNDTTWVASYDPGPFPITIGFPILRSDTIRYAPQ